VFRVRRLLKTGGDVKRLRQGQGLFQVALAQRAGLSVDLVKKIEQGAVPISKKSRERLAAALLHA
jgi:transcriptional regulator with XRE-family HTH domain